MFAILQGSTERKVTAAFHKLQQKCKADAAYHPSRPIFPCQGPSRFRFESFPEALLVSLTPSHLGILKLCHEDDAPSQSRRRRLGAGYEEVHRYIVETLHG